MKRNPSRILTITALAATLSVSALAAAQTNDIDNPECLGSNCGRPNEAPAAPASDNFIGAFTRRLASLFGLVFG